MPWSPLPGPDDADPAPLGSSVDRLLRNLGAARAGVQQSVFDAWPDVAGEQVAAHAVPQSLRDGVLVVAVDDPAWATQLRFLETELLAGIAARFGPDEVTRVEVRVRPGGPSAGPR